MPTFSTLKEGGEKLKGLLKDAFTGQKKKKKKSITLSKNKALQAYNKAAGKKQSKAARDDAKLVKSGKLSKKEWQKRHMPTSKKPELTDKEKLIGKVV